MGINVRNFTPADVDKVYDLVKRCPPLRLFDKYIYRVQAEYFPETCFVAEKDFEIIGFISGFVSQKDPLVFFVWQYCVLEPHDKLFAPVSLIKNMIQNAREMGCQKLQFTMDPEADRSKHVVGLANFLSKNFVQKEFLKTTQEQTGLEKIDILYDIDMPKKREKR